MDDGNKKSVLNLHAPRVVVRKAARLLEVWDGETLAARMRVALGGCPEGPKRRSGDGRTPEGSYRVCVRNAQSRYHLALGLDYPNAQDAARGRAEGLIGPEQHGQIAAAAAEQRRPPWDTALGGEIMIHGGGTASDWTAGCIAVENADMDVLWEAVPLGTPVRIEP